MRGWFAFASLFYSSLLPLLMVTLFCNLLNSLVRRSYSRFKLSDCDFIASLSLRSRTNSAFNSASFCFSSPIFNQSYLLSTNIEMLRFDTETTKIQNTTTNTYFFFVFRLFGWSAGSFVIVLWFYFVCLLLRQQCTGRCCGRLGLAH